jgi:hypothetical protein
MYSGIDHTYTLLTGYDTLLGIIPGLQMNDF